MTGRPSSDSIPPLTNVDERLRGCWHPLARIDELPAGTTRRVHLLGEPLVVARLSPSAVLVAPDRCVHRGARLSDGAIVDGCLRCPYHGWRFGADGSCQLIPALGADTPWPARAQLAALPVRVALGLVWTRLDRVTKSPSPAAPPDAADLGLDPDLTPVWLPDVVVGCTAAQFVDNFCDVAHFPFVHAGTFGAGEAERVDGLAVERCGPTAVRLRHVHTVANREDPSVATGERPLQQPRHMEYLWLAPFTARLALHLPLAGTRTTIVTVAAPRDAATSTVFTLLARNDLDGPDSDAARAAVDYELAVLQEDVRVLEHLAEPAFPLDVRAEVHTPADRFGVEIRRVLSEVLGRD